MKRVNVFRTLITLGLSLLMISNAQLITSAYAISADENYYAADISFAASINDEYTDAINSGNKTTRSNTRQYNVTDLSMNLSFVNATDVTGNAVMVIDDNLVDIPVEGQIHTFEGVAGYVGVLDGEWIIGTTIDGELLKKRITIDLNYISPVETFTAVTVGSVGSEKPEITFLGDCTSNISELISTNTEYSMNMRANNVAVDTPEAESPQSRVNARIEYRCTATSNESGYETVTVSLYHAAELENQNEMSVYAKINSHTDEFIDYLIEEHGFSNSGLNSLMAYPDSYNLEIVGADRYLRSTRTISPEEDETVFEFPVTVYIPYLELGYQTIGIPITMNSVSVSYRGVAINPIYTDNIVTWDVYKRGGWNPWDMDGYYNDSEGAVVYSRYTYEENVDEEFESTMGAIGELRYEYIHQVINNSITLHMWTESVTCANEFTIIP